VTSSLFLSPSLPLLIAPAHLTHLRSVSVLNDMLSDPSMRLMALEGIERILAIGETKINRSSRRDSLSNPNPYASLVSVEAVESLHSITKTTSLGKRVTKLHRDHFTACTICHKLFHKNTAVLKVCEECRGPVCLKCDCSIYHLSYQEEVWDLIESMEEEAKRAQKKKKKQKAKASGGGAKAKKPPKGGEKSSEGSDTKTAAGESRVPPEETTVPGPTTPSEEKVEVTPPKASDKQAVPRATIIVSEVKPVVASPVPVPGPGAGVATATAADSSDESFIAVSRHKRRGNDRDRDRDKQDRDRKGKAPPVARKPPPQSKPPPSSTSAPAPSSTTPRPAQPTRADRVAPQPPIESRSSTTVARYADAVLQLPSGASSSAVRQSLPPDSLSSDAEFPPLSLNQSLPPPRRGEKKSSLLDPPATPGLPAYPTTLFQPDSSPPFALTHPLPVQRPLSPPTDSSPLSRLLAPPTFDFSNPSSHHALSDLFSPGLLSPPPVGDGLSHGLTGGNFFSAAPPPAQAMSADGSLFSPTGLSGDVDIEDGDLHMRRAEMLLTDDDEEDSNLLNTSRETEDLVEFLQETGSIAALAERLGFRK
jgi:hypothetical protein